MKKTYIDFIKENPNCSQYETNIDAIAIFEILSKDKNIIAMIDASNAEIPALAPCVNEIETYIENKTNSTIDFNDRFTRTVIGRMIKTILEPFGYGVTVQRDLPKSYIKKYFKSASCYEYKGGETMSIMKTILNKAKSENIINGFKYDAHAYSQFRNILFDYPALEDEFRIFLCYNRDDMFWYNARNIPPVQLFLTIHGRNIDNILMNFNDHEKRSLGAFFGYIFVILNGYTTIEPPIMIDSYGIKTASCFEKCIDD